MATRQRRPRRLIRLGRTQLGNEADRATFQTLHNAALASPALREGLNADSAERAARHLRALLGTPGLALFDHDALLAFEGLGTHHAGEVSALAQQSPGDRTEVFALRCDRTDCDLREAVAVPLLVEEEPVGLMLALTTYATAGLVRATEEVGRWVSGQLDLAELDASRRRAMAAEVRALRAQISPHFIYNSLSAIASFVRTDPDRARELLLEFADFTRYSFRSHGEFTTLAEELKSIERYLTLEQARFGERLQVRLQIAPEVLGVVVPFLCLQPLVENAVRHGLEDLDGVGHLTIVARDDGPEAEITIEDNGVGEDPETVRRLLAGDHAQDSVGLGNVDSRLRNTFGERYGLVVETAPGAGTMVTVRVPKFAPGVAT